MELAHDAGLGRLSLTSILAGMLCAFGSFAVLAAIAGGILTAMGVNDTADISGDWRDVGVGTTVVLAVVLFCSYLFGGYVAGRMARRAGLLNGLLVFALSLLVAAGIGAAVGTQADTEMIMDNLRSVGIPTSADEWAAIGTIAGVVALASMLLGSLVGGTLGERWHGKLLTRAMDPSVGDTARDVDLRDRTLDTERAETRDRTLVSAGHRPDGHHYATDHNPDTVDGETDDGWDGNNRMRSFDDTSTTLDSDLEQQKH
jgi:hypothetical protein